MIGARFKVFHGDENIVKLVKKRLYLYKQDSVGHEEGSVSDEDISFF